MAALRQDGIGADVISDVVLHDLKAAFRLGPVEREAELVEVTIGKAQPLEKRAPDPPTTVIRAKGMVIDNQHPCIRLLDPHLAR